MDGSIYLVSPMGMAEVPDIEEANMAMLMITGKIARTLGFKALSMKATCLIPFCLLYLAFYLMRCVLSGMLGIIF